MRHSPPTNDRADADNGGNDGTPPRLGLSVRLHRIALIVASFGGFFGSAYLGVLLFGNFWGVFCAGFGAVLMQELFHRFVPAICPECGHRADCLLSSRDDFWPGEDRSGTVIRYECRSCDFQLPRRVSTKADLAAAASSAIRVAGFAKGFFTLIGLMIVAIATFVAAQRVAHQDFPSAAIALGVTVFGVGFTIVARHAVTGFADAVRTGTQQVTEQERSESKFEPLEGVVEGIPYHADSLSYGNVEVWIDLPQRDMRLPQQFFETRSGPFDPSQAEWGSEQIQALFDLGAADVDVGFHTDHIQVVFPQDRVTVTRELAERAVSLMLELRRQALRE